MEELPAQLGSVDAQPAQPAVIPGYGPEDTPIALYHFHHGLVDMFSHMVCSLLFLLVANLSSNLS